MWVFTGMGPQWWAMGRELFEKEPVYREAIERCDREFAKLSNWSLIEELNATDENSHMAETWLAQPANFAVQVALAAFWRSFGVCPDAIVGHSARRGGRVLRSGRLQPRGCSKGDLSPQPPAAEAGRDGDHAGDRAVRRGGDTPDGPE